MASSLGGLQHGRLRHQQTQHLCQHAVHLVYQIVPQQDGTCLAVGWPQAQTPSQQPAQAAWQAEGVHGCAGVLRAGHRGCLLQASQAGQQAGAQHSGSRAQAALWGLAPGGAVPPACGQPCRAPGWHSPRERHPAAQLRWATAPVRLPGPCSSARPRLAAGLPLLQDGLLRAGCLTQQLMCRLVAGGERAGSREGPRALYQRTAYLCAGAGLAQSACVAVWQLTGSQSSC